MINIAVLVSGGGTNLQALLDAETAGKIPGGHIKKVISSKPGVFALERAVRHGVETAVIARAQYTVDGLFNAEAFDEAMLHELESCKADLLVTAGFLSILGPQVLKRYENSILNVHPALIPAFCGNGYYGMRVHEEALDYGVKLTGATVHFVNEVTDGGAVVLQKAVEVRQGDTPETLQKRVLDEIEHRLIVAGTNKIVQKLRTLDGI
jgi:phosphoribosylglycinamide formyltransferase-1